MDEKHPLFRQFPTECHSNWQWWSIVRHARPFILNATRHEYKPLIQVVDNVERNHKLGLLFEFAVDNGKVLVCMSNLEAIRHTPEGGQLAQCHLSYMKSAESSSHRDADLTAVAAHINNRGEEARHCRREKPVGLRRTAGINMRSFIIIPLFLGCPVIFQ